MKDIALKQIHFSGITMQIPEIWNYETDEYNEEEYSIKGKILIELIHERPSYKIVKKVMWPFSFDKV